MKPKLVLASLAVIASLLPPAGALAQGATALSGEVLETINVESYTYLRLKTAGGEVWAAVPSAEVKKGAQVSIAQPMVMNDFESRTLKRRFDKLVFGQLAGTATAPMGSSMLNMPRTAAPAVAAPVAKVPKASGPDARTVAEVVQGRAKLKDKTVVLQARVTKVNTGIMGKNWLHLQDGSGAAQDGSNDLLITSSEVAARGDIVTVRGTVRTDVNLGSGYAYQVIVEDAKISK